MNKTFTLTQADPGGTVGWQIFSKVKGRVDISLKGDKMFYFSECLGGDTMRIPAAQGAKTCADRTLTLTMEGGDNLDITVLSNDILGAGAKVVGRSFRYIGGDSLRVDITVWNKMGSSDTATTLQKFFYKYLTLKDKYLFNYLSDYNVNKWYNEAPADRYTEWFESKLAELHSKLDEFKLALAFLLYHDNVQRTRYKLHYSISGDLLMAEGTKIWGEPKITVESCPFRNIRGVILNETERSALKKSLESLSGISLFTGGTLKVAASHGSASSTLKLRATHGLGFENLGLYVAPGNVDVEKEVIEKAVKVADKKGASILIFPELSVDQDSVEYLKTVLKSCGGGLKVVVGGSRYVWNGSNYFNRAPVLVNCGGTWREAATYDKMIPFSMGYSEKVARDFNINTRDYPPERFKTLSEDIAMEDNVMILPFADCVLGIAICRDVLDLLDSHNPLHKYCDFVDVMLVISDNNGDSNMFVGTAECLARWHNCATVYTNSVAETRSHGKPDTHLEVSFGLYPYKGEGINDTTLVKGVITYLKSPLKTETKEKPLDQILSSDDVRYTELKDCELENCCKVYELVYPQK